MRFHFLSLDFLLSICLSQTNYWTCYYGSSIKLPFLTNHFFGQLFDMLSLVHYLSFVFQPLRFWKMLKVKFFDHYNQIPNLHSYFVWERRSLSLKTCYQIFYAQERSMEDYFSKFFLCKKTPVFNFIFQKSFGYQSSSKSREVLI